MTRSHSCSDIEKIIRSRSTPALLTKRSKVPNVSSAAASRLSPVAHSPMSPAQTTAWPPAAAISSATALAAAPSTSLSTSRAPAPASAIASARPRPFPAPVTIPVLPSRLRAPVALSIVITFLVAGTAQHTAVGHELAAGRVRRVVGGEERHEARDLDRLGESCQRHRREERGPLAVVGLGL